MRFFALIAFCLMALVAFTMAESEEEFCACPRNLDPVCGSDSITYPNSCELGCAAQRSARQGRSLTQTKRGRC